MNPRGSKYWCVDSRTQTAHEKLAACIAYSVGKYGYCVSALLSFGGFRLEKGLYFTTIANEMGCFDNANHNGSLGDLSCLLGFLREPLE